MGNDVVDLIPERFWVPGLHPDADPNLKGQSIEDAQSVKRKCDHRFENGRRCDRQARVMCFGYGGFRFCPEHWWLYDCFYYEKDSGKVTEHEFRESIGK